MKHRSPFALSTGPLPVLNDLQADLRHVTADAIRPLSAGLAALFGVFIVFNLLDLPDRAVVPVVALDAVIVVAMITLYIVASRKPIPLRWAHALGAGIALLVLSNVLLTFGLLKEPFYTNYVGIIMIGVGSFMLSRPWMAGVLVAIVAAWAPLAWWSAARHLFAHYAFTLVAAGMVAVAIHVARVRTHRRIVQLRMQDAEQKMKLEDSLRETEHSRTLLDRKVEQRTAELGDAYNHLDRETQQRKRLETQRVKLESSLRHAQKMESIGRLAGGVAHDFNNLLTVISGNLQLAQMSPDLPEDAHEALEESERAAGRAAGITRQLLAFSRKQILEPKATRLDLLIDGIRKMLKRVAGEDISLVLETDDCSPHIYADPGQIEQVIMNLVINACDAIPDRGTVTIRLSDAEVEKGNEARDAGVEPGDYVRLAVTDTGHGMDEETRRSIFEPFYTTKETGKGTGLGLAVVHGIVSQHKGFINVRSAPGRGSTFEVYLPRSTAKPAKITSPGYKRLNTPGGRETILIAEDEDAVRQLAARMLRRLGYRVLEAASGREALSVAGRHAGKINLLIADVIMPGMDGRKLADLLAADRPEMKVLFASGHGVERLAHHGVLDKGLNFLPKPYDIGTLAERVRRILDDRRIRGHRRSQSVMAAVDDNPFGPR